MQKTGTELCIVTIGYTEEIQLSIVRYVDEHGNVSRELAWRLVRVPMVLRLFWAPVNEDGTVDVDLGD